jgi:hypothetical protein
MADVTSTHFVLSDKLYNSGKRLVQVVLPAISALYFGLANIWGLPSAEQVVGTIAVLTTFLGVVLGISSKNYDASGAAFDGDMVVVKSENGVKTFNLNLDDDPANLENKNSVRFKVKPTVESEGQK